MATRVEHRIEIIRPNIRQTPGVGQCLLGGRVIAKAIGLGGLCVWLVAFRIQRWLATGRGHQRDVGASVLEGVVRSGELFEPEAGFLAGVAKLIVRSQNHQDFHKAPLVDQVASLRNGFAKRRHREMSCRSAA